MARYLLEYKPSALGWTIRRTIEAVNRDAALRQAAVLIAERHNAAGEHVQLNENTGFVMVGAGWRSFTGNFTLSEEPPES